MNDFSNLTFNIENRQEAEIVFRALMAILKVLARKHGFRIKAD